MSYTVVHPKGTFDKIFTTPLSSEENDKIHRKFLFLARNVMNILESVSVFNVDNLDKHLGIPYIGAPRPTDREKVLDDLGGIIGQLLLLQRDLQGGIASNYVFKQ